MLQLNRPLAVFDLEATGTDPDQAYIIEVAIQRLVPEGHPEATKKIADGVYAGRSLTRLLSPPISIPEKVTEITGISDEDVEDAPTLGTVFDQIKAMLVDADLAGFNCISYDVKLLKKELRRFGYELPGPDDQEVLDVYQLEKALQSRSLSGLYQKYTDDSLDDAHRALADVEATITVLRGQLSTYGESGTPRELAKTARGDYYDNEGKLLMNDPENPSAETIVFTFGKHKTKSVAFVQRTDPSYLRWMMGKKPGHDGIPEVHEPLKELLSETTQRT